MQIFKEFYNNPIRSNIGVLDAKIPERNCMVRTSNMWDYSVQSNVYFFGNTKQIWPIFVSVAVGLLYKPNNESYQSIFKKVMNGQYSLDSLYPSKLDPEKTDNNMHVFDSDNHLKPTGNSYDPDPNYSIDNGFNKFIKGQIKSYSVTQELYFKILNKQDEIISYENHLNKLRNELLTKTNTSEQTWETNPDYKIGGEKDEQTTNNEDLERIKVSIDINERTLQLIKLGKPFGHTMDAEDWSQQSWNTNLPPAPIYQWIHKQTMDGDPTLPE